MSRRWGAAALLVTTAVAATVAGCGEASPPGPSPATEGSMSATTGPRDRQRAVSGLVELPASGPSCFPDEPCDQPVLAGFLVFSRAGELVARAPIGAGGAFSVRLEPGSYDVRVDPGGPGLALSPASITVPEAGLSEVRFRLSPVSR